jgi:large subunit ribosomal protein L24
MSRQKVRIRQGDQVKVIAGKDKGRTGRVLRVNPEKRQVVVEGIARVRRHHKPVGDQPGGIVEKEMPIDVSNVALWNAENNTIVRVAYRVIDGQKVRVDRKNGAPVDA